MAEKGASAAISIGGGRSDSFDTSLLSQSLPLPFKPRSLARESPAFEPDLLVLPESSPAEQPCIDQEVGRTLIRYTSEISAEEFTASSPAERQTFLSQSCPNWSTFAPPREAAFMRPEREEEAAAPGSMAVPSKGRRGSDGGLDGDIIAASPTILESFKMYNAEKAGEDPADAPAVLEEIREEPAQVDEDDEEELAFSLEA